MTGFSATAIPESIAPTFIVGAANSGEGPRDGGSGSL